MTQDNKKNALPEELEGSLETIKEILVGENTRDMIKRIKALEEKLGRELSTVQAQLAHRIESLETFIRKEILVVRDDLRSEKSERVGAVEQATAELTRVSRGIEQKLGQANQSSSQQFHEAREQLNHQSRSLAEEIVRSNQAIYSEIERVVTSLESRKPDRQLLAAIFLRMASALQATPEAQGEKVAELRRPELKKSG